MTEVTNADLDSLIAMARGYGFVHWIGTESKQPTSFSFQFDDFVAMVRALSLPHKAMHALAPGSQAVAQEAVHWRCVLDAGQIKPEAEIIPTALIAGFTTLKAANQFCAEKKGFYGWNYTIEPLYLHPLTPPPARIASEEDAELAVFIEWAGQVAKRDDVPKRIREAAAQLHARQYRAQGVAG